MKILEVTGFPNNGSGSGILMTNETQAFINEGHQVHTLLSENRSDFPKVEGSSYSFVPFKAESEDYEKIENQLPFNFPMFTTHVRSTNNFNTIALAQVLEIEKRYKDEINKLMNTFKPDIIHAQHNWIHAAVCVDFNVPVIITIHGTDLMGYEKALASLNEAIEGLKDDPNNKDYIDQKERSMHYIEMAEHSARNCQKVIVISKDQKERFCSLFPFAASKVVLIKNGYDTNCYYVMDNPNKEEILSSFESQLAPNKKVPTDYDYLVAFVGKFAAFKGIDTLIDAASIYERYFEERNKKVVTVIVGSGALDKELKEQAIELELKNLHFVGLQTPAQICRLQNIANVSLIPSRNEPFGLVVIEGAACGHPVIASNSGGIPDILNTTGKIIKENFEEKDRQDDSILKPDEGTTGTYTTSVGILVPTNNAKELAKATIDVLTQNKKFDNSYIANYMQENYSQNTINKLISSLFEDTIKEYNN